MESEYDKLVIYVTHKEGKVISKRFLAPYLPMTFECKIGHRFDLLPKSIWRHRKWCPQCKQLRVKYSKPSLLEIVEYYNGRLLSINGPKGHRKVTLACENDHLFELRKKKLWNGSWCLICQEIYFNQIAEEQNIKILEVSKKHVKSRMQIPPHYRGSDI